MPPTFREQHGGAYHMKFKKAERQPGRRGNALYEALETGVAIEITVADAAEGVRLYNNLRNAATVRKLGATFEWAGNTAIVQWVKK